MASPLEIELAISVCDGERKIRMVPVIARSVSPGGEYRLVYRPEGWDAANIAASSSEHSNESALSAIES